MEYFEQKQIEYLNHQELHEISTIVKDKDCLSCEKCYPIRVEIPKVFEKVWKILKKFESSIEGYNQITVTEVLNLLSIDSRERDDYNRIKTRKVLDRLIESIRYNKQPDFKEKGLRQILVVIARDCIENDKENEICDKLIGNLELIKYGYILEDWDIKIRFEKFWNWYITEHKGKPIRIKDYGALEIFKEILYLVDEINETNEELPYKAKRLISELANENIEYRGSRFSQNIILKVWNKAKETRQFSREEKNMEENTENTEENIEENSESSIESYRLIE